jgi:Rrf2 family protein
MKFSTRSRYGMRAMLDIAINGEDKLVLLKDIAERQAISKRYLEHMMTQLRNSGLVMAERGASGGYRLGRPASEIRLDEIFEALEGKIAPVECLNDPSVCERSEDCVARELWDEMRMAMCDVLESKTLEDLKMRWEEIQASHGVPA